MVSAAQARARLTLLGAVFLLGCIGRATSASTLRSTSSSFSFPNACVEKCVKGSSACGTDHPKCLCREARGYFLETVLTCMYLDCPNELRSNYEHDFISIVKDGCDASNKPIPDNDIKAAEGLAGSLIAKLPATTTVTAKSPPTPKTTTVQPVAATTTTPTKPTTKLATPTQQKATTSSTITDLSSSSVIESSPSSTLSPDDTDTATTDSPSTATQQTTLELASTISASTATTTAPADAGSSPGVTDTSPFGITQPQSGASHVSRNPLASVCYLTFSLMAVAALR
ncbi:hypothetical protein B0T19DRAFT_68278 [Cercophora scortea]|uniref:Extracellular membrane protein CFEM domain-containing protein n=1 Tax=Cercophora scortea TaxID=314031 RepID=A0AAE0J5H6_9PEZI|nr:hypothetical protein B0T19DRAFT_68278 [Cercophora scortea]